MKERMKRRIISLMLAVVMVITTISFNSGIIEQEVKAAEVPKSIKMPVVIYDHLADGFLFEYDFANANSNELSMEGDKYKEITGMTEGGQGLIESELGENGTPVYKKPVVERTAELIKNYLEDGETAEFPLFKQLYSQIVKDAGSAKLLLGKDIYQQNMETMGWSFSEGKYAPEGAYDYWKDNNNNVVWYRDGDWLYTNGGVSNKGTFDFGILEAGTYQLKYYDATNVKIQVVANGEIKEILSSGDTFEVKDSGNVKLTVTANDNNKGNLTNPKLFKDGVLVFDNFTKPQNKKLSQMGWNIEGGSTWIDSPWGGITCNQGEKTDIYYEAEVLSGKKYCLKYYNENDFCSVKITDENGNKLADGKNVFTVPAGVNKIKIILSCNVENAEEKNVRFDDLYLNQMADVIVGDYQAAKEKFDKGAKLADISSCMDYAYYIMNNFWTDTNGDITQKTELYKTITLDINDKYYTFSSANKVNYDLENGNIYQDAAQKDEQGFYPLDTTLLGNKSDLKAPYGAGSDILNQYDGLYHNYHYAMKAHCEFLYKESDNLEFKFNGDDDVYLFIDNKLVLDIGGAHLKKDGIVDVNEVAKANGLKEGEIYTFDFFYMERHTTASNLTIETNMILEQADAKPSITYKDKDGNPIESGEKVNVGDEIEIEYSVKAGSDGMSDITFNDTGLGIILGKDGIDLGKNDVYVKDKITVTVTDKDGNIKETYSIDKNDLNNPYKVNEFADNIGKIIINKDETVTVDGIYKKVDYDTVMNSELNVDITAPIHQYGDDGTINTNTEVVSVVPVTGKLIPKSEPKASVDVNFVDKNKNILPENVSEGTYTGMEYVLTANSEAMKNIGINDDGTGFSINSNGITIPNGFDIDEKFSVSFTGKDGAAKETVSLTKEDIENKTAVYNDLLKKLGNGSEAWELNTGDKVIVNGVYKNIGTEEIKSDAKAEITGPVPEYNEETNTINVRYKTVYPTDTAAIKSKPASNVLFTIDSKEGNLNGTLFYRVDNGTTVGTQPLVEANKGYSFDKWTVTVNGITSDVVGEPKDVVINSDTVFTAHLSPNSYPYTVKYVDKNTGKEIADAKKANAVFNTTVEEKAVDVEGYTVSGEDEKSITIKTEGNEIIFEYEINEYPYTVKYVDKATGKELLPKKEGISDYNTIVNEKAVNIEGYTVSGEDEKSITIKTEGNDIVFEYDLNKYNVEFKADEHGKVTGDLSQTVNYKDKVSSVAVPTPDKGYEFLGWDMTTSKGISKSENPGSEVITENTVFTAKFGPEDYGYEVRYVDEDGNDLAAPFRGEPKTFGTNITEKAIDIAGYTADADEKTIVISADENVIKFVYSKNIYDVKFNTDGNGRIEGTSDVKVKYEETVDEVPNNVANEGYKFVGWTMTVGDKESVAVDDPKAEKITDNTVFTAHYELDTFNYTVRYVDESGKSIAADVVKSAVFGTTVTESPIEVSGYTTSDGEKSIEIKTVGNEIIFVYKKNEEATTPPESKDITVKDASNGYDDENGYGYGINKGKGKDKNKSSNNDNETGNKMTVSPKTGYIETVFTAIGMLGAALLMAILSLLKIRKYYK